MITPNEYQSAGQPATTPVEIECTKRCMAFGAICLDHIIAAIMQQARIIEQRVVATAEFEMFTTKQSIKRGDLYIDIFYWKSEPIVEVEFSDYFYIKKLPVKPSTKNKNDTIL